MKPLAMALALWFAGSALQFVVTDGRGKQTSAITLEAGAPDENGWSAIGIAKAKGDPVLIWPWDGSAKMPDGPEPVPAIVIQRGEQRALANKRAVAAIGAPVVLGIETIQQAAGKTGFTADVLGKAIEGLTASADPLEKGVGLLFTSKPADAAEQLATALRERQRQLTRIPSEIRAALLYVYGPVRRRRSA